MKYIVLTGKYHIDHNKTQNMKNKLKCTAQCVVAADAMSCKGFSSSSADFTDSCVVVTEDKDGHR